MNKKNLKLLIFLTDPMKVFFAKGEIKERYYNPCGLFSEVHMISFCAQDIDAEKVQATVGDAKLFIHPVGKLNLLSLTLVFKKLNKLLELIKPDLIRAYDISLRGVLSCIFAKRAKIPCVISLHSNYDEERKYDKRMVLWIRKILELYSLANCDLLICVTDYLKGYAQKHKVKKICVIYNRVNISQFACERQKKIQPNEPLKLLSLGRLVKQKNQECILRAIKDLNVKLTLIGSGNLSGYLHKLSDTLKISHKVEFIPFVRNQEIQRYYHQADIFVISSFHEGFCIPLIEAMASGLPVVAVNIAPIAEVLNGSGYLCDNNPDALKRAIEYLSENLQVRDELSKKGMERVHIFDNLVNENKEKDAYLGLLADFSMIKAQENN